MTTLVLVPSALEAAALREAPADTEVDGLPVWHGTGHSLALCGIGGAATAFSCARLISALRPHRVVLVGIAGAFARSGLQIGDVVQAHREIYADLGYRDARGYHTLDHMGLPMLPGDPALGCEFALAPLDTQTPTGCFVTLNAVTADAAGAEALAAGFGADVENMEGAAAAMVCARLHLPFHEVRAVSNFVGPRDPAQWAVKPALARLKAWMHAHDL